jgi:hypothetical protein
MQRILIMTISLSICTVPLLKGAAQTAIELADCAYDIVDLEEREKAFRVYLMKEALEHAENQNGVLHALNVMQTQRLEDLEGNATVDNAKRLTATMNATLFITHKESFRIYM